MWLLITTALAAPTAREPFTLELGAGALPVSVDDDGVQVVSSFRAHGDHRFKKQVMLAWDAIAVDRTWTDGPHDALRLEGAAAVGWHNAAEWGDLRLYAGPSVEHSLAGRGEGRAPGLAWLDASRAAGRVPAWSSVGLVLGNDLDFPFGPVRFGGRWRVHAGWDLLPPDADEDDRDTVRGVDVWELHAVSLTGVLGAPVAPYVELGWTNEFTLPTRKPSFRVSPWLLVGLQARLGKR